MGLLSSFKRQSDSPGTAAAAVGGSPDAVLQARTRARRRLIGAAVLLGIGIVGFPLVFETQPRPIPVNIPIETPPKESAPALTMPVARAPAANSQPAAASAASTAAPKPTFDVVTEPPAEAAREVTAPASTPLPAKPAASKPAAATATAAAPPQPAEAARAQALLEGRAATPAETGRFVVQVGAFADANAARETRLKVEKLGLKTYTQVASTAAGNRIRVRAGPFASRAEADRALAKAQAAGLTAVVLTL